MLKISKLVARHQENDDDFSYPPTYIMDKDNFLYPRSRYYGEFSPEELVFNANLQEFSQRIGYISGLQTSGKLSSQEAYSQIKMLWKGLKKSREELGIGKITLDGDENHPEV